MARVGGFDDPCWFIQPRRSVMSRYFFAVLHCSIELRQKRSDEKERRVFVQKDPYDPLPSLDLLIQPFLGVAVLKTAAIFLGKDRNAPGPLSNPSTSIVDGEI